MTQLTLSREIEIWNRYGAYLIGVRIISSKFRGKTFQDFLNAAHGQLGGWGEAALRNAWNAGQE